MIRIILVSIILILLFWFLGNRNTLRIKAGKKLAILIFLMLAIFVVIFPEVTDSMANFFGVGRGTDLLVYMLTVTFIAYVLNQYMKNKSDEQRLARLARKIALLEAGMRDR